MRGGNLSSTSISLSMPALDEYSVTPTRTEDNDEDGVRFHDLKKDETRLTDTPMRPMEIACRALDADYLIDLPVLKGHCQTEMTCALKNLKGCLPGK